MRYFFKMLMLFFISSTCVFTTNVTSFNYDNTPPDPPYIEGPATVNITEKVDYYMTVTDPDQHYLFELYVEFGDGTNKTLEPYDSCCVKGWRSGQTLTISHKWKEIGDFTIRAKVKDFIGDWSDWGTFQTYVSKSKTLIAIPVKLKLSSINIQTAGIIKKQPILKNIIQNPLIINKQKELSNTFSEINKIEVTKNPTWIMFINSLSYSKQEI